MDKDAWQVFEALDELGKEGRQGTAAGAKAALKRALSAARAEGLSAATSGLDVLIQEMRRQADLYDSGPEEEISSSTVRAWVAALRAMQDGAAMKDEWCRCPTTKHIASCPLEPS